MTTILFIAIVVFPFLFPLVPALNMDGLRAMWVSLFYGVVSSYYCFGFMILYLLVKSIIEGMPISPWDEITPAISLVLAMMSTFLMVMLLVFLELVARLLDQWETLEERRIIAIKARHNILD